MFIIVNHYTNENIGAFDNMWVMDTCYDEQAAAIAAADAMLQEDILNSPERETVAAKLDDITCIDETLCVPVHIAGVMEPDGYNYFHNIYMVFEVKPAEKGAKK